MWISAGQKYNTEKYFLINDSNIYEYDTASAPPAEYEYQYDMIWIQYDTDPTVFKYI